MGHRCKVCKEKPAYWHPQTKGYLCPGHSDQYRREWRATLEEWAAQEKQIDRDYEFIVGLLVLLGVVSFVGAILVIGRWII
jgi:hypothetical protein